MSRAEYRTAVFRARRFGLSRSRAQPIAKASQTIFDSVGVIV
jgi:hypothetical protein